MRDVKFDARLAKLGVMPLAGRALGKAIGKKLSRKSLFVAFVLKFCARIS